LKVCKKPYRLLSFNFSGGCLKNIIIICACLILLAFSVKAQEKIINQNNQYGVISDIKESGSYLSVKYYNKQRSMNTAVLYNTTGNEVLKIEDAKYRYIRLAEYIPTYNYYLVIFEGGEAYQDIPLEWDKIRAINIITGKTIWEAESNALYYEVSPDAKYVLTKSPTDEEDDRPCQFEVFSLQDGTKIAPSKRIGQYRATWLEEDKALLVTNETKELRPQYLIDEERVFEAEWLKKDKSKYSDYKNNKISKDEYTKFSKEALRERSKKLNEFSYRIHNETKNILTSKLMLFNITNKQMEYEKIITDEVNNNFAVNFINNKTAVLNVDKDKNVYVLGYLVNGKIEQSIHYFIKYDKNMNIQWKSTLLPLTKFFKYSLDQKPYYGFSANQQESFVEPVNGSVIPFAEVQKTFNETPSVSVLRKWSTIYQSMQNFKMDLTNNGIVIKVSEKK
jgi:hypothetical protein